MEIGAIVTSLDPSVAGANPEETSAKDEINALIYGPRNLNGKSSDSVAGTGPFRIAEWDPGKHLTLAANDDYRDGRPYVDSIEIQIGERSDKRFK